MQPKLTVELVPANMWGANLRAILAKKVWDIVRRNVYAAAGHKCEICGETGKNGRVECHERWEFDDLHSVQKLVGLICLCPTCHQIKHIGRYLSIHEKPEALFPIVTKLAEVNGWNYDQIWEHIGSAMSQWEERSTREWKLDVTWLGEHEEVMN